MITPKESLWVAHPANAKVASNNAMRHAAWPFAINCTAFNYSAFNILLEPQVAALHQLLDLFLADPDLAVVHQADQRQVHLVVAQLRFAGGVDDGIDGALQHEVGAFFLPHRLARGLAGVEILILALVGDFLAFRRGSP